MSEERSDLDRITGSLEECLTRIESVVYERDLLRDRVKKLEDRFCEAYVLADTFRSHVSDEWLDTLFAECKEVDALRPLWAEIRGITPPPDAGEEQ